jgi:hypothetical protein
LKPFVEEKQGVGLTEGEVVRKPLLLLFGLALSATLVLPALGLGGNDGRKVIDAKVLAPVIDPYTGAANAIRGVAGGGLPWQLESGNADLRAGGQLHVEVQDLVLAQRAPVPTNLPGTNPFSQFNAIVSCLTSTNGTATTANIVTDPFDVTSTGDGELNTTVTLPSPCFAPIVFVTAPGGGAWFAATGS